jgi:formylmethanofuran:tetrahydromethanopterin formyltransferase
MNNLHSTTSSTDTSLQTNTNIHAGNDDDDDDDIPEQIETVIEILFNGLRDKVR